MLRKDIPYFYSKIMLFIYVVTLFTISFQTEYSDISQLCGIALGVVFFLESVINKKASFFFPKPLIYSLLFLFIITGRSLSNPNEYQLLITVIQLIVLSFIIINIIARTKTRIIWPVSFGALVGTLILNYRVWDFLGNTFTLNGRRMASELINPNLYAMYLCIGVLFSMYFLFYLNKEKIEMNKVSLVLLKIVLFIIILSYAYLIITLSGSRKGILAIFLLFLAFVIYSWKNSKILVKFLYVIVLPLLLIFVFNVLENTIGFQRLTHTDNSTNTRTEMIHDGLELWSDRPFLGWGIRQFGQISGYDTYSHNNYVELLANNGLVGFVSYYAIFISIFYSLAKLQMKYRMNNKYVLFWCYLMLFILLFWDIGRVSYYSKSTWLIISVVIGLMISMYKECRSKCLVKREKESIL